MRYLPLIKNFQKGKLIISKIEINLYLTIKLILVKISIVEKFFIKKQSKAMHKASYNWNYGLK